MFAETFGLPTEGTVGFLDIPKETMSEMRSRFSGSDVPFRSPIKKKEMNMEFRLPHDIVATTLCAKAGSFDMVTSEMFDMMGYAVQLSILLGNLVKADLGESVKLHPQKVLTGKSVATYIKKNWKVTPTVETIEMEEWLEKDARVEQDGSNPQLEREADTIERALVVRSGPEQSAQQTFTYVGQGIFEPIHIREINWVTHILSKIAPEDKVKGTLEVVSRPNQVEEHCQLVLNSAWEVVSNMMADFDEWIHIRTAVKLRDISSFEDLTQIEDKFFLLAETVEVSELLQCRSLLMYKLYETEVQNLFDKNLENFKIDVPSFNHDYLCIRFLNNKLKEIATQHRAQRVLAGLPIADQEQAQDQGSDRRTEKIDEVVRSVVNIEETANETREHEAPNNEHQAPNNEHRALDEQMGETQNSMSGQQEQPGSGENPTPLEDHSINNERAFHDKIDAVVGNVKSSQKSLETTVLNHLTEHQIQLASVLGFVKMKLAELVDHFKNAGDAKKGKGGQGSRSGDGSGAKVVNKGKVKAVQEEKDQARVIGEVVKIVTDLRGCKFSVHVAAGVVRSSSTPPATSPPDLCALVVHKASSHAHTRVVMEAPPFRRHRVGSGGDIVGTAVDPTPETQRKCALETSEDFMNGIFTSRRSEQIPAEAATTASATTSGKEEGESERRGVVEEFSIKLDTSEWLPLRPYLKIFHGFNSV
ncbi:phosphoglycerate mutase-like [Dorcoceras hygrometricum]|uniref:Phosphoglycerate mutase-like n=1 Tax=Dorcoceras hygrometricum TaxID=472368 RepID=A0A2Z7BHC4_9LAMI|nr:phosphoglycerate mutase-like [Dorcoceras hygrometricum]